MVSFPTITFFSPEDSTQTKNHYLAYLTELPGFFENFDPKKHPKSALKKLITKHLQAISLLGKGLGKLDKNQAYYPLSGRTKFREFTIHYNPFLRGLTKKISAYVLHLLYISWIWVEDKISFPEWIFLLITAQKSSENNYISFMDHDIIRNNKKTLIYFFATRCWELLEIKIYKESGSTLCFKKWKEDQYSHKTYLEPKWYREKTGLASSYDAKFYEDLLGTQCRKDEIKSLIPYEIFRIISKTFSYRKNSLSIHVTQDPRIIPYNIPGNPLSIHRWTSAFNSDFEGLFVVDLERNLYCAKQDEYKFFCHSSFLGGRAVLSAGSIFITSRHIASISNDSGHYKPKKDSLDIAIQCFITIGYTRNDKTEIVSID